MKIKDLENVSWEMFVYEGYDVSKLNGAFSANSLIELSTDFMDLEAEEMHDALENVHLVFLLSGIEKVLKDIDEKAGMAVKAVLFIILLDKASKRISDGEEEIADAMFMCVNDKFVGVHNLNTTDN